MLKRYIFLWSTFIAFIIYSSISFADPTIYLAKNPYFLNRASILKNKGFSTEKIIAILISNNYLQKMTPALAQETFGITWLEKSEQGDLYKSFSDSFDISQKLPNLIIANMGTAGFGLFAAETIQRKTCIAEYTGEIITNQISYQPGPYVADAYDTSICESFRKIDALRVGGPARFAQHLPNDETLSSYNIMQPYKNKVATANSALGLIGNKNDRYLFLYSLRRIEPFEQIGYCYGEDYGFQHSSHADEPYLFDKSGDIIPKQYYTPNERVLVIFDARNVEVDSRQKLTVIVTTGNKQKIEDVICMLSRNGHTYFFSPNRELILEVNFDELKTELTRKDRSKVSIIGRPVSKEETYANLNLLPANYEKYRIAISLPTSTCTTTPNVTQQPDTTKTGGGSDSKTNPSGGSPNYKGNSALACDTTRPDQLKMDISISDSSTTIYDNHNTFLPITLNNSDGSNTFLDLNKQLSNLWHYVYDGRSYKSDHEMQNILELLTVEILNNSEISSSQREELTTYLHILEDSLITEASANIDINNNHDPFHMETLYNDTQKEKFTLPMKIPELIRPRILTPSLFGTC